MSFRRIVAAKPWRGAAFFGTCYNPALPESPKAPAALARILELSFPSATLVLPPSKALGHRLAAGLTAKNPAPPRPFALVDGLAVCADDLRPGRSQELDESTDPRDGEQGNLNHDDSLIQIEGANVDSAVEDATVNDQVPDGMGEIPHASLEAQADELPLPVVTQGASSESLELEPEAKLSEGQEIDGPGATLSDPDEEPSGEDDGYAMEDEAYVFTGQWRDVRLRGMPGPAKRDDTVVPGSAMAVRAGEEVPRGADFVIPFEELLGPPEQLIPEIPDGFTPYEVVARLSKAMQRRERRQQEAQVEPDGDGDGSEDNAPSAPEPLRAWDLVAQHQSGAVQVPILGARPPRGLIQVASWARQRDTLLAERTLLRAGEVALLEALGVDEIEVFRKPVIGIASLAPPMPVAQRKAPPRQSQQMMVTGGGPGQQQEEVNLVGFCPLTSLAVHLCRSAQVAALPLGFAPQAYRPLAEAALRWLGQVDILLLIGGQHYGPRCLAQDLISGQGDLRVPGVSVEPCTALSAGMVEGRPVFAIPGGLPELLSAFVMFVRPLAHKYNPPLNFQQEISLALECGSRLRSPMDRLVPVRYGWSQEHGGLGTRYCGDQHGDPWLQSIRSQAIALIEGGRQYRDGDKVRAFPY